MTPEKVSCLFLLVSITCLLKKLILKSHSCKILGEAHVQVNKESNWISNKKSICSLVSIGILILLVITMTATLFIKQNAENCLSEQKTGSEKTTITTTTTTTKQQRQRQLICLKKV